MKARVSLASVFNSFFFRDNHLENKIHLIEYTPIKIGLKKLF